MTAVPSLTGSTGAVASTTFLRIGLAGGGAGTASTTATGCSSAFSSASSVSIDPSISLSWAVTAANPSAIADETAGSWLSAAACLCSRSLPRRPAKCTIASHAWPVSASCRCSAVTSVRRPTRGVAATGRLTDAVAGTGAGLAFCRLSARISLRWLLGPKIPSAARR